MVSRGVRNSAGRAARAARGAAGAVALIAFAACGGGGGGGEGGATLAGDTAAEGFAERVRGLYRANDVVAAGMWTWAAPGATWVLVDVQSTVPGIVQARVDLWLMTDTSAEPVGRSDPMPAAAAVEAFAFRDLTGDGLPDLLGSVADSAGTSYVVFVPGARGAMAEELETAAAGWRFSAESDSLPSALSGAPGAACALRLWAEEPVPDGRGAGWRWLAVLPRGRMGPPGPAPPTGC